jgi:cell wall-associated NlpC family hydrolase
MKYFIHITSLWICVGFIFFNFSQKNKKESPNKSFFPKNYLIQKDTLSPKHQSASMGNEPSRLIPDKMEARRDSIRLFAEQFLGTRYAWGGTQPGGFDCSGYALYVFKKFGYNIPRVSGDQVLLGDFVSEKNAQAGDLAYYGYAYGQGYIYTHTANCTCSYTDTYTYSSIFTYT